MDCKEGTALISQQMVDLLRQLDNGTYAAPLDVFNGASVGQHFRHIIDFYNCLLAGGSKGLVDYCHRERNPLVETDALTAISALRQIQTQVAGLDEAHAIMVKSDFSADDSTERISIPSSVGRELMYAYDHALHHLALIKIGMQIHFPHIPLDQNLGVAPSTIKYRQRLKEAGER